MAHVVKKFLVVGVPRSGSTYLINQIAQLDDVFLPAVNQYELFNVYEKLYNCRALRLNSASELGMLDGFFAQADRPYAGLKTLPGFHREWPALTSRTDIQFITLLRRDFLSCLASYVVSEWLFRWTLPSREQIGHQPLVFRELFPTEERLTSLFGATLDYILFNYRAVEALSARPHTIALWTESLQPPAAQDGRLDEYFGRSVPLVGFQTPTHYTECFADHFYYKVTVVRLLRVFLEFDTAVPVDVQALLRGG